MAYGIFFPHAHHSMNVSNLLTKRKLIAPCFISHHPVIAAMDTFSGLHVVPLFYGTGTQARGCAHHWATQWDHIYVLYSSFLALSAFSSLWYTFSYSPLVLFEFICRALWFIPDADSLSFMQKVSSHPQLVFGLDAIKFTYHFLCGICFWLF